MLALLSSWLDVGAGVGFGVGVGLFVWWLGLS